VSCEKSVCLLQKSHGCLSGPFEDAMFFKGRIHPLFSLQLPRVKSVGPLGEGLGAGEVFKGWIDHGIYFAVLFAGFWQK